MLWRWIKTLRRQDAQVQAARDEVALSEERLREIRRTVVDPIRRQGNTNQFADLIRRSLIEDHR